jgi:AcrR family transcriptional regulator
MPTDSATTPGRRRRTQAERRAATRGALLDATIECLVEYGYANVTTSQIAERAGVTRGAQAHHFSTKAELVTEAVRHLTARLATEYLDGLNTRRRSVERILDDIFERVWQIHTGPLFAAAMEVWIAARTDADLREHMVRLEIDVLNTITTAGIKSLPQVAVQPVTAALLARSLATIRGLALLMFFHDRAHVEKQWQIAKRQLLDDWMRALSR